MAKLKSETAQPILKGITTQLAKDRANVKIGENLNIIGFALRGIMVSLSKSFTPSAIGCNSPKKPVTLGPCRL